MVFDVGIIGVGSDPRDSEAGYSMGYHHASGYQRVDSCQLVCCADINRDNAVRFADRFGIPDHRVYDGHEPLLADCDPDIVSVCTPPPVHGPIVEAAAKRESVEAIHCEKPMAPTWDECRDMVAVCEANGVNLTFNHQRRFGKPFTKAKDRLDAGEIGSLRRIEIAGKNLFDYGTHLFDLAGYFTDQANADWVLSGLDYRDSNVQYGVHNENQAVVHWMYETGVHGIAVTGEAGFISGQVRLLGDEGVIEIGIEDDGPALRIKTDTGSGWTAIDTGDDGLHDHRDGYAEAAVRRLEGKLPLLTVGTVSTPTYTDRAIAAVVQALAQNRVSALDARNALQATELIFASWESARRRSRVDLPLEISDNPLESMVEAGHLAPGP